MNILGTAIVFIPTIATTYGKENGWVSVVVAVLVGLILLMLYPSLIMNGKGNFFDRIEYQIGSIGAKALIVLLVLFGFFMTIGNIWSLSQFISVQILMGTPPEVIAYTITFVSLYAIRSGLEVIARSVEVFFLFTMMSLLLLAIFVWPETSFDHLLPIMQLNQTNAFVGAIPVLAITYVEVVILIALIPHVNDETKVRKSFLIGGALAGICMIVVTVATIAVIGVEATTHYTYSIYRLGQNIQIAEFFDRIEGIVAFIWFFTIFFKISTTFYILMISTQYLFKVNHQKVFSAPLALLLIAASKSSLPNIFYDFELMRSTYLTLSYLVMIIVVLSIGLSRLKRSNY